MHRIICRINANSAYAKAARTIGAAARTTFIAQHDRPYAVICFDSSLPLSRGPHLVLSPPPVARFHQNVVKRTTSTASISTSSRSSTSSSSVATPQSQSPSAQSSPIPKPDLMTPSPPPPSSLTTATAKPQRAKKLTKQKRNYQHWKPEEEAIMHSLKYDYNFDWRTIGVLFSRPHTTCFTRYVNKVRPALDNDGTLSVIQDQALLQEMVQQGKAIIKKRLDAALMEMEATKARKLAAAASKTPMTVTKRIVWDPVTDQAIVDMVKDGASWSQIGKALNRNYASCYSRYHAALDPVLKETWPPDVIEKLNKLAFEGLSWNEISKRLKIPPTACRTKWVQQGRVTIPRTSSTSQSALASSSKSTVDDAGTSFTTATATTTATTTTSTEAADEAQEKNKNSAQKGISFSVKESHTLISLVHEHGEDDWDLILEKFHAEFIRKPTLSKKATRAGTTIPPVLTLTRSQGTANKRILSIKVDNLRYQFMRLTRGGVRWTFDQETILIQQVLRLGTEGHWNEIARATGFHSPQDCRTRWKNLDMPVNLNKARWSMSEQGTFWSLWCEFGSDFKRLSRFTPFRSPVDCQRYFESATKGFPDIHTDPEAFNKKVQELCHRFPNERQRYLFTKDRSLRLQDVMRYYFKKSGKTFLSPSVWDWVASKVQRGMSALSCMDHWAYLQRNQDKVYGPLKENEARIKPQDPSSWNHEELKLLDQGVRECGSGWSEIQQRFLPWRNTRSIRQRWMTMSDRTARVTEDEYYTIVGAGNMSSEIDYDALKMKMPGWNRSPCRRIFETSYKHIAANTVWLPEEDRLLLEKTLEERGRDWNAVAKHFDGVQTARASLYAETMVRMPPTPTTEPPMRTHKSAWQCRLRWSQLLMPMMPIAPTLSIAQDSRHVALKLSKQLLDQYNDNSSSSSSSSSSNHSSTAEPLVL